MLDSPPEGDAQGDDDDDDHEDGSGGPSETSLDDDETGTMSTSGTGGTTEENPPSSTSATQGDPSDGEDGTDEGPIDEVPPGQSMDCLDEAGALGVLLQAECGHGVACGSGITGSQSGTELENEETTIGYFEPGDWLSFEGVDLSGLTAVVIRYAKAEGEGQIELRLGSPTGMVVATFTPGHTGGWQSWTEDGVTLQATSGRQTLYVVAAGGDAGVANLDWIELTAGGASTPPDGTASGVWTNQLGYEQTGAKHAVIQGENISRFTVVDGGGQVQWCGDLSPVAFDAWGGGTYYVADFSGLSVEGDYRMVAGGRASEAFTIGREYLFDTTLEAVVGYFRGARADDEDVWATDGSVPLAETDRTADVRGGWYDASGDISKYLSHLSYANFMNPQQIPLVAWALAYVHDVAPQRLAALGAAAAVEDEALWGADYLLRALDQDGYFYITVFDGWTGEMGARQVCAFEGESGVATGQFQAAFREGAGMAIAALARIGHWGVGGTFTANEYIAGAERAFEHLQSVGAAYADDGVENVIDDYTALLAASELFAATAKEAYLEAARSRSAALLGRLHADGYFIADGGSRPFWHASDAGLPVVALARYIEIETDASKRTAAVSGIEAHLEYLLSVTGEVANPFGYARQHFVSESSLQSGFFIPHDNETDYWWQGENARLASLAAAAFIGGRALPASDRQILGIDARLARFAGRQLDWILGENPFDISFINGFGRNNPPEYMAAKSQVDTHVGGISNGITGSELNGGGIQWLNGDPDASWADWRWIEQWLPHSAWYLVAIASITDEQ